LKSYQEGMILNQSFVGSANILPIVGARSYFCAGCRSFKSDNGAPRWVILARISRNHTKKGMITYKLTTGRYDFKNGLDRCYARFAYLRCGIFLARHKKVCKHVAKERKRMEDLSALFGDA